MAVRSREQPGRRPLCVVMTLARRSGSYESLVGRHITPLSYLHGARFYSVADGRDIKRQISETDEYIGDARSWRHCKRLLWTPFPAQGCWSLTPDPRPIVPYGLAHSLPRSIARRRQILPPSLSYHYTWRHRQTSRVTCKLTPVQPPEGQFNEQRTNDRDHD